MVATTVQFGPYLTSAKDEVKVTSRVIVGPKGSLDATVLHSVWQQWTVQQDLATTLAPLHAKDGGTHSVTVWQTRGEELTQCTVAQYPNELSRNMGLLRTDKLQEVAGSAVPASGSCLLVVVVPSVDQCFPAGLAVSRNWPLYCQKTSKEGKETSDRVVYVDFVVKAAGSVNYQEIQHVANAIRMSQKLIDTPCADLHTDAYLDHVQNLMTQWTRQKRANMDVQCKIIKGKDLETQGFGGLWGVGKAAEHLPALVILSRVVKEATQTVALVGKGIVYDTGGLSLKQTAFMCGMKDDMGGSAGVLGAFAALVETQAAPTTTVHALLCLAENALDAKSYRNDDILHMYSKKTVEINNTDAEGRLVLADGVAYASQHLTPHVIIDMATLTGAQMVVTGKTHAGVLCGDETLERQVVMAGKQTGDLCFPFLYAPELLKSQFESPVADMKNSVKDRSNAPSSAAGHFIQEHLSATYKGQFVHLDIAGPGTQKERGTGFGVALLYQFVKSYVAPK